MTGTRLELKKDGAKRRRKYLRDRTGALSLGCVGFAMLLLFGAITLLGILSLVFSLFGRQGFMIAPALIFTLGGAAATYLGAHLLVTANNTAVDSPYVPPVREQIAALFAAEVLLRGSDQPPVMPEELLRASGEVPEAKPEELLRPAKRATP